LAEHANAGVGIEEIGHGIGYRGFTGGSCPWSGRENVGSVM